MTTGPTPPPAGDRDASIRRYVEGRLQRLLADPGSSRTRALLARLRGAVAREPGEVPEIWSLTIDGVPGAPRPGDDSPTAEERAVHAALTLFALHQQSRAEPMHRRDVGLGLAVRRLEARRPGRSEADKSPVRRRFDAVVLADTFGEVVHHLRGLITQMRADGIALDYAQLADDLLRLQRPGGAHGVRLRWARQYHHTDHTDPADPATEASNDAPVPTPEESPR